MVFLSLAQREARVAARKRRLYVIRAAMAASLLAVVPLRLHDANSATDGQALFESMGWMAFIYSSFAGVFRTCDCLSEEKREGTLGLLLLTDLRPGSVLVGKILAAAATTFFGLLAIVPILALPILLGAVTGDEFLRASLNLVNTLFLSIAWGIFISSVVRKHVAATLLAFAAPLFFSGVCTALTTAIDQNMRSEATERFIGLFAPLIGQWTAFYPDDTDAVEYFWRNIAFNHVLAWGFLFAAAYFFPRKWQDIPSSRSADQWQRRIRTWRYGTARERAALRRRLLSGNPLVWFVNRDRLNSTILFLALLTILLIGYVLNVTGFALPAANLIVLFRIASEASHSVSEDQKNGALELLLSTELSVRELVGGRVEALERQFLAPVSLIIGWQLSALESRGKVEGSLAIGLSLWLVASWFALAWIGPWFALRAKRPANATWMSLGAVLFPPAVGWIGAVGPTLFEPISNESHLLSAATTGWIGVGHCALLIWWARRMLLKNFRAAAADKFVTQRFERAFATMQERDRFLAGLSIHGLEQHRMLCDKHQGLE